MDESIYLPTLYLIWDTYININLKLTTPRSIYKNIHGGRSFLPESGFLSFTQLATASERIALS